MVNNSSVDKYSLDDHRNEEVVEEGPNKDHGMTLEDDVESMLSEQFNTSN
jgi:hypothetical protein